MEKGQSAIHSTQGQLQTSIITMKKVMDAGSAVDPESKWPSRRKMLKSSKKIKKCGWNRRKISKVLRIEILLELHIITKNVDSI